jgi:hypothetical protein
VLDREPHNLEVIRTLNDHGHETAAPIELAV